MPFLASSQLLTMVGFLPAPGGLLLFAVPAARTGVVRAAALSIALLDLAIALLLLSRFDPAAAGFQFSEPSFEWIPALGVGYRVGVDGISLLLVLLTALLIPISILGS